VTLRGDLASLHRAMSERRAIGSFTIYDVNAAKAVVAAAETTGTNVILQAGSSGFAISGEAPLRAIALAVAGDARIDVGVHLDHSRDLDELRRAVDGGYTSVMIDGSHLDFAANVELTRRAMDIVDGSGVWLEAELGAVGGDEDRSTDSSAAAMTDPQQAQAFVDETGVHALAVAVGNVHGFTARPARLDLDRLGEIRDRVTVPLILHGASGLDADDIARAIVEFGVAKVNVNAELRRAYVDGLRQGLAACAPDDLTGVWTFAVAAVTLAAGCVLRTLDPLRSD
jgi:tagatose 1,6-diphosphate aldolase GatY/KbaY